MDPAARSERINARLAGGPAGIQAVGLPVFIVLLLLATSVAVAPPSSGSASVQPSTWQGEFDKHIQHIVVLMMENHAFDNYYGLYCQKLSKVCPMTVDGLPPGLCVPEFPPNATPCIHPFVQSQPSIMTAMPHSGNSSVASWDNGSNDGFYLAESAGRNPFGAYNRSLIPIYWDLAEQYALGDQFFSSTLSYSLPNHWHLVAGQEPSVIQSRIRVKGGMPYYNRTVYLNQANRTATIQDLLLNSTGVSWKYYDRALGHNYTASLGNLSALGPVSPAFGFWDPLAAKAESYNASFSPHFVNRSTFFGDAAGGRLSNLSILIPPGNDSDHPPASVVRAQGYVASVVDAVESSPEWNSTALFITWDEYGGFYDHVTPPLARGTTARLGFRVPLIVVSPWSREGYVDPSVGYFESLLRLMEDRYSLPCLTAMDCHAPALLRYFNFSLSAPRAPIIFPTTIGGAGGASYPMTPQPTAAPWTRPPPFAPPLEGLYAFDAEGPDVD